MGFVLEMFGQFGAWILAAVAAIAGFFYVRKQQGDKKLAQNEAATARDRAQRAEAQRNAIQKAQQETKNVQDTNSTLSDDDVIDRLRSDYRKD